MSRVITIDPGKSKCGLVLAEISEKKVYKAIILKSELIENALLKFLLKKDYELETGNEYKFTISAKF